MSTASPRGETFEEALVKLEQAVRKLEDGQIGLEEALQSYEEGIGLLKHCYGLLQKAEQRIMVLTGVDEQGKPLTTPFEASAADAPAARPTSRRTRRAATQDSGDMFDG